MNTFGFNAFSAYIGDLPNSGECKQDCVIAY